MTYRASRLGARIREVPITFRDRRIGQSKMSRRIVVEALVVVVQLRLEEIAGRLSGRSRQGTIAGSSVVVDVAPLDAAPTDPQRDPEPELR